MNENNQNRNQHVIIKQSTEESFFETISSLILTKRAYKVSFHLLLLIGAWISYFLWFVKDEGFILSQLESESKNFDVLCWLINTALLIILWNIYAFFFLSFYNYNYSIGSGEIIPTLTEDFYKNPFFFSLMLYYVDDSFFSNSIDNSFWFLIILNYYFISLHLIQFFKNLDFEIVSYNNNVDAKIFKDKFLSKLKIISIFFFISNCICTFFVYLILVENDRNYTHLLLGKGIFIGIKILELYFTRRNDFLFLLSDINTKEKTFISGLKMKMILEMSSMIFLYFQLLMSYNDGQFLIYSLILIFFLIYHLYKGVIYFKSYRDMKNSYESLDKHLVKKVFTGDDECVICTEKLNEARTLDCHHSFHLICLGRWILKGYKTCPICRKNIRLNYIPASQASAVQRQSILNFGFNSNILTRWIPNFTMRIVGFINVGGRNQNTNNTVNNGTNPANANNIHNNNIQEQNQNIPLNNNDVQNNHQNEVHSQEVNGNNI